MALTKSWTCNKGSRVSSKAISAHGEVSDFTTLGSDEVFANAYIKVVSLNGGKNNMSIYVEVYPSQENQAPVFGMASAFTPSLSGDNFIAQAYTHIKTLPEFQGAKDC